MQLENIVVFQCNLRPHQLKNAFYPLQNTIIYVHTQKGLQEQFRGYYPPHPRPNLPWRKCGPSCSSLPRGAFSPRASEPRTAALAVELNRL